MNGTNLPEGDWDMDDESDWDLNGVNEEVSSNGFINAIIFIIALSVFTLYYGVATWLLWGWFMVPLGIPAINIFHAAGLNTFITLITVGSWSIAPSAQEKEIKLYHRIGAPVVTVAIGWVLQFFMV